MMFFARALKCGAFGANGLTSFGASAPRICSFNNDPSAIEPRPSAQWPKKWRRVSSRNPASRITGDFILFATNRFIQVQHHTRDRFPCFRAAGILIAGLVFELLREQLLKTLRLRRLRRAREAKTKCLLNPLRIILCRGLQ